MSCAYRNTKFWFSLTFRLQKTCAYPWIFPVKREWCKYSLTVVKWSKPLKFNRSKSWNQKIRRGESRTVATSKMEHFAIIVNGWKLHIGLEVAAVLDPPLRKSIMRVYTKPIICKFNFDIFLLTFSPRTISIVFISF